MKTILRQFLIIDRFALFIDEHHLVVDLIKIQVPFFVDIPGGAKFTIEAAAYLGGNAGSVPVSGWVSSPLPPYGRRVS